MIDQLNVIPDSLSSAEVFLLVVTSFFTSFLSVSIGIGGGTILLALMAQIVPVKAIIPVHGAVQLGSNLGRASLLYKHIQQPHIQWFFAGGIIGAVVGGNLVVALPVAYLKLTLGVFILYSVWGPKPNTTGRSATSLSISGALSTLLTMFVGATGPFVMASIRSFGFKAVDLVATNAACLVTQHTLKLIIFTLLGFAFSDYLLMILLMVFTGVLGTLLGKKVLFKINEELFKKGVNIILSLLALRLVYSGLALSFFN